jgi:hypothetical protein
MSKIIDIYEALDAQLAETLYLESIKGLDSHGGQSKEFQKLYSEIERMEAENKLVYEKIKKLYDEKEEQEKTEFKIYPISLNTYVKQLLNENQDFVDIFNVMLEQIKFYNDTTFSTILPKIRHIFEDFSILITEKLFNTENLKELISGELTMDENTVYYNIYEMMKDQTTLSSNMVTHFPNVNLDLIQTQTYNKDMYEMSCRLGFSKFYQFFFNNFCNQPIIHITPQENETRYLNYCYDIKNNKFEMGSYYSPEISYYDYKSDHVDTPFIIGYSTGIIGMDTLNHSYLYRIISESNKKNNRFVFFPLVYIKHGSSGHACFIVFDTLYNKVFILDPNGTTNFLTSLITPDSQKSHFNTSLPYLIELFRNYLHVFNEWNTTKDTKVNFEFSTTYDEGVCINYSGISSYNYDMGHCQPLVLFIVYLLYTHQDMFSSNVMKELSDKLRSFSNGEIRQLKYNVSANYVKIGIANDIIKMKI